MLSSIRIPLSLLLGVAVSAAWAEDGEVIVTIDQVPQAVKESLLTAAGDAKIVKIEKETNKDVVVYEAEWLDQDGKTEVEVTISEDGKVLKTEREAEGDKDEKGEQK